MQKITQVKCFNVNCFIVEGDGGAILIDTAASQYKDKVLSACEGKNIRLIVLTHGHLDHVQNAAALSKALGAPIAMHKADYELAKDNMTEIMYATHLMGKFIIAMSKKMMEQGNNSEAFEPQVYLSDGDTLESYGVQAKVIGLPGHTKGSIGILVGETDIFVGDALMNMFSPSQALLYGDKAVMAESAAKIGSYKGATVHFGHGKPVVNRAW
jgi:glyoxylase-like metal-dependent hydrolase (beta-lactamase superfamily II)